jgi:hypothetical protein
MNQGTKAMFWSKFTKNVYRALIQILKNQEKQMAAAADLAAAVSGLQTAVAALQAADLSSNPEVEAAVTSINAASAAITAVASAAPAAPAPAPAPAPAA